MGLGSSDGIQVHNTSLSVYGAYGSFGDKEVRVIKEPSDCCYTVSCKFQWYESEADRWDSSKSNINAINVWTVVESSDLTNPYTSLYNELQTSDSVYYQPNTYTV